MIECPVAEVDEAAVVAYLRQHPDLFVRHPALLDELTLPHAVPGAVSLLSLQQTRQRERISGLEQELAAIRQLAGRNEHIFRVYSDVYSTLFSCTTLRQLWKRLHTTFRARLRIPVSALWVNDGRIKAKRSDQGFVLPADRFRYLCQQLMPQQRVYLGRIGEVERQLLFGQGALVHSVVLLRLGEAGDLGVLAFGHANGEHYQADMDSLLLEQLGRFVTLLLPNMVTFHD